MALLARARTHVDGHVGPVCAGVLEEQADALAAAGGGEVHELDCHGFEGAKE